MENLAGIRDSYGQAMIDLAAENERVVALVSDAKYSSKLDKFESLYPDRFFDVGCSEQNMAAMAGGMALEGKIPYISAIACFVSMRCFEMVRTVIGYQKLNVKIVAMSAGFSYPQLGATHTCVEDIAIMRTAANITVIAPADNMETYKATKSIAGYDGPVFMRLGRHPVPPIYDEHYEFVLGKGSVLREGGDVTIVAIGPCVAASLEAYTLLSERGIKARVINMSSIKPLDEELLLRAAQETGFILTVEEHNIMGGMGSTVAEFLSQRCPVKMKMIGIPNENPPVGSRDYQLQHYGLTPSAIARTAVSLIREEDGDEHGVF